MPSSEGILDYLWEEGAIFGRSATVGGRAAVFGDSASIVHRSAVFGGQLIDNVGDLAEFTVFKAVNQIVGIAEFTSLEAVDQIVEFSVPVAFHQVIQLILGNLAQDILDFLGISRYRICRLPIRGWI